MGTAQFQNVTCTNPAPFLATGQTWAWSGQMVQSGSTFVWSMTTGGGCTPILINSFQSNFNTAGGCGIAFAVIMFVGLAFTCYLMRGIKDKGMNIAIEKNRLKTQKDLERRRAKGKGGLKIPDNVL